MLSPRPAPHRAAALLAGLFAVVHSQIAGCGGDEGLPPPTGTGGGGAGLSDAGSDDGGNETGAVGGGGGDAGDASWDGDAGVCSPGSTAPCYSGPPGTLGVGTCTEGTKTCLADGSAFGPCVGEVVPGSEDCAAPGDEDCDGASDEASDGCVCAPGATTACYEGPPGTADVGICRPGTAICAVDGKSFGACEGQILPLPEACATPEDDDCDGASNEGDAGCICVPGSTSTCYSGPAGTAGVGICQAGNTTCDASGESTGPCQGEVLPAVESCATPEDDDCDGSVNEPEAGCGCAPGATSPCYSGPQGTSGVGVCQGGIKTCDASGTSFGPCEGEVTPSPENCDTLDDENCDGWAYPCPRWASSHGASGVMSRGRSVAVDAAGNIIVAGEFAGGSLNLGGGALTHAGGFDVFVAKFAPGGEHLWSKRFGDSVDQSVNDVAVDGAGNVLVTGSFRGTMNWGGGNLANGGNEDIYVAKLDPSGGHLWSKSYGDIQNQIGRGIAVGPQGEVLVTGYFLGTVNFGGLPMTAGAIQADVFALKLAADGAHVWSKQFGDAMNQYGEAVEVDADGAVVLTGAFHGAIDFSGGLSPMQSAGSEDVYLAKLGADGAHQWSKRFGGTSSDWGPALALDAQKNVLLAGIFTGDADFGGGALSGEAADACIARFTPGGAHLWSKRFGDAAYQFPEGIAADPSGNVILVGRFQGKVNFGGGELVAGGVSAFDVFLVKFSAASAHQFSRDFGDAAKSQEGWSVATDAAGNIVITGSHEGTIDFGTGPKTAAGPYDLFVAKFAP